MINKKAEIKNDQKMGYTILIILVGLLIIVIPTVLIYFKIERSVGIEGEDVLATTLASYWGAIIGGILSGALSFFGVFCTIRYYKKSDEQKQRASVQPFLFAEIVDSTEFEPNLITGLGKSLPERSEQKEINIKISNIGNGFAKLQLMISGVSEEVFDFPEVLKIDETIYLKIIISIHDLLEPTDFSIQYIDSMTNKYIQKFIIRSEVALIDIESDYPQLCKR